MCNNVNFFCCFSVHYHIHSGHIRNTSSRRQWHKFLFHPRRIIKTIVDIFKCFITLCEHNKAWNNITPNLDVNIHGKTIKFPQRAKWLVMRLTLKYLEWFRVSCLRTGMDKNWNNQWNKNYLLRYMHIDVVAIELLSFSLNLVPQFNTM